MLRQGRTLLGINRENNRPYFKISHLGAFFTQAIEYTVTWIQTCCLKNLKLFSIIEIISEIIIWTCSLKKKMFFVLFYFGFLLGDFMKENL